MSTQDEFDKLFADVLSTEVIDAVKPLVEESKEAPIVQQDLPEMTPLTPEQAAQPHKKWQPQILDENKVFVEPPPFAQTATIYPAGYVKLVVSKGRFLNQFFVYRDQLEAMEHWFTSPEYQAWKADAVSNGLRKRGE